MFIDNMLLVQRIATSFHGRHEEDLILESAKVRTVIRLKDHYTFGEVEVGKKYRLVFEEVNDATS